ncbi:hypothetical protein CEUSTIGMA_g8657.t1 [Chlamydomonas eustigma]|uniref:Nudix hydrolase domain-containing protein n=1 Tax=Chlamydomonas eustigma TaxID=1157962 RepID=A0A250XDR0_9CHLO|nr:hypothetical protein CEUSTIGMA_g8657.t1 [Chlamydomonas eustigma]|eukprot:GAX81225.1 hypothetical protein CEUSTIGMA_g8657.t1 [Chlamydomonas eustigma]
MEPSKAVMELIELKFLKTAPKEVLSSMEQTMFLVEHAYWYYEDSVRDKNPELRHFSGFEPFAKYMFSKSEILSQHLDNFADIMRAFNRYKHSIPVYGAILLDGPMEKVLLVRGLKSSAGWGFPRGKVNQGESGIVCAAREVEEETGMNIEELINPQHVIQVTIDGKLNTLYIVTDIDPQTTAFAPQTKGEIGAYGWHYIEDLPASIEEANKAYLSSTGAKHRFFGVQPFIQPLRRWIRFHQERQHIIRHKDQDLLDVARISQQDWPIGVVSMMSSSLRSMPRGGGTAGNNGGLNVVDGVVASGSHGLVVSTTTSGNAPALDRSFRSSTVAAAMGVVETATLADADIAHMGTKLVTENGVLIQFNSKQGVGGSVRGVGAPPTSQRSTIFASKQAEECEPWMPSMSNFRFDTEAIMRCFY